MKLPRSVFGNSIHFPKFQYRNTGIAIGVFTGILTLLGMFTYIAVAAFIVWIAVIGIPKLLLFILGMFILHTIPFNFITWLLTMIFLISTKIYNLKDLTAK